MHIHPQAVSLPLAPNGYLLSFTLLQIEGTLREHQSGILIVSVHAFCLFPQHSPCRAFDMSILRRRKVICAKVFWGIADVMLSVITSFVMAIQT